MVEYYATLVIAFWAWFILKGVVDINMAGWRGTYKHVLKLEVVGDARVGKTCLAARFGEYNFLDRYHPTMGMGESSCTASLRCSRRDCSVGVDLQVPYLYYTE